MKNSPGKLLITIRGTLDHLPFTAFHFKILTALGISWIIDGYEVSLLTVLSGILKVHLDLDSIEIAQAGSFYLLGCVFGAAIFSILSNTFGRKSLFSTTLFIYIFSILCTSLSYNKTSFFLCRLLTGVSIGGEYTAVFAAIDELIPVNYRGMVNIIIDGTWHLGAIIACLLSYASLKLNRQGKFKFDEVTSIRKGEEWIWRSLFLVGALVAIPVIIMRKYIPESPRWLYLKGQYRSAVHELRFIKEEINIGDNGERDESERVGLLELGEDEEMKAAKGEAIQLCEEEIEDENEIIQQDSQLNLILRILFIKYPTRFIYALTLMATQSFFYNGVYYTFGLVLEVYFKIPKEEFGIYLIPISVCNFLGPIALGALFDLWSRRMMIFLCYLISGLLLIISSVLFIQNYLDAYHQIMVMSAIFFIASPGASAAHLTVSEIFPTSIRSDALAIFFAIGLLIGGVISPLVFGALLNTENRVTFALAYLISASLMLVAAVVTLFFGVESERKSLEQICEMSDSNIDRKL